jgi:hypothetical protein
MMSITIYQLLPQALGPTATPTFASVTAAHRAADGTAGATATSGGAQFKNGLYVGGNLDAAITAKAVALSTALGT